DAGRLCPDVDEVLVYDAPWVKATAQRSASRADHELIRKLRAQQFDAAVIFTVYSQSPLPAAMMCYLADIPRRPAHCHEHPYHLLTDWVPDPEPASLVRHEVRRQLDLVAAVGWYAADEQLKLRIPPRAAERVARRLEMAGIREERPWVVVHPGASAPSRRYSETRFAAVIRTLVHTHGWQVVLTGTRSEEPLLGRIRVQAGVPVTSFGGSLSLPELAALLDRAPLLI